jgi:predicted transcriptional regulator of viral defense system
MTMQSYTEPTRPYGEPLGLRLVTALESVGTDPFNTQDAQEEANGLGLSRAHTLRLLNQLTTAGRLTRLKRGLYAINDPVTKQPRAHAFAIGTALVSPSAVSHWSALQHWGLTEQIPATVTLTSPRRSFPPDRDEAASSGHRAWSVAGTRYEVITVAQARFFGAADVWIDERNRVPIFDRERALLDAFQHFHVFGSLSVGLQVLEEHLAELDLDRLIDYALRLRVGAVVKRLGWALSHAEVPPSSLQRLLEYPAKGDTPLDPGRPSRGRHDPVWRVIENLGAG